MPASYNRDMEWHKEILTKEQVELLPLLIVDEAKPHLAR